VFWLGPSKRQRAEVEILTLKAQLEVAEHIMKGHDAVLMAAHADNEAALAAMGERMKKALDEVEEAKQQLFAKTAEVQGLEQAYQNVGSTAGYRLRKNADESWADYKERVRKLLETHRDADIVKAILDILSFQRREVYREWKDAKAPDEIWRLHAEARAIERCLSRLALCFTSRDARTRHEEDLQGLKDWALLDLDEKRLASVRKPN
jgi:chromosome segregation ATPase